MQKRLRTTVGAGNFLGGEKKGCFAQIFPKNFQTANVFPTNFL